MKVVIKCERNKTNKHSFFLEKDSKKYLLFVQDYHKGVNNYFSKGVTLTNALDRKKAKSDFCIIKTMDKFTTFIKYVEKEYDIKIFDKSKNIKGNKTNRNLDTNYMLCA